MNVPELLQPNPAHRPVEIGLKPLPARYEPATIRRSSDLWTIFWPYASRCGPGLAGYLVAVGAVAVGGAWSAVWSWRHRAAKAHLLSLLLVLWGLSLAAIEVLPRVGYAKADPTRSVWICQ